MQKQEIEAKVVSALKDMTQDWDLDSADEINAKTGLIKDLEFESIDIVQLAVALEQAFDRKGLPFEQLFMRDGDYVEEIRVGEVVDFMADQLGGTASAA